MNDGNDYVDAFECAMPHRCPKEDQKSAECVCCDLNYRFIADKPLNLECGHQICLECSKKIKDENLYCKICVEKRNEFQRIKLTNSFANNSNIENHLPDLYKALASKFTDCFETLEGGFYLNTKKIYFNSFKLFH